jgi:prepilin-type N-terminal cleavage/methylation domain-containing protein
VRKKPLNVFPGLRGRRGFTLIELLIVMSIIAILATIAVPVFLGQRTRAMQKEAMTNLESLRLLQEQFYAEEAEYAPEDAAAGTELGNCGANQPGNVDAIRVELPAFRPGLGADLYFSYCIEKDRAIDTGNPFGDLIDSTPCFTARAFGNLGRQVEGQEFRVDCNNVKTY